MSYTLIAHKIYTPTYLEGPISIIIRDQKIGSVSEGIEAKGEAIHLPEGHLVTPGLVDTHAHGARDYSSMSASEAGNTEILRAHARMGTTSMLLATVAEEKDRLVEVYRALAKSTESRPEGGARLLGSYCEGRYGSEAQKGGHLPEYMIDPDYQDFLELWEASQGTMRVLAIAPERQGGSEFIQQVRQNGAMNSLTLSLGHTDADYEQAMQAIQAGIRRATHICNGMRKPNQYGATAVNASRFTPHQDFYIELIGDGLHVCPVSVLESVILRGFSSRTRTHNSCFVSDANPLAGFTPQEYEQQVFTQSKEVTLSDDPVELRYCTREGREIFDWQGGLFVHPGHPVNQSLFGSRITLIDALRNSAKWMAELPEWKTAEIHLGDLVRMVTLSPAKSIGADQKGSIEPGKDADIVVLDPDYNIELVMVEGEIVVNNL